MSSKGYDHVRRRLIVCCDGTWQSSVSGERNIPSNVTRMCRHLARSEVRTDEDGTTTLWVQMVFYDPGIGTGDISASDSIRQGGTGAGLTHNVIEAYNWLVMNYQAGDKIYCFGFSRGAYTARSLAGMISDLGICSPMDMQVFPIMYDLYEDAIPDDPSAAAKREEYERKKVDWLSGGKIDIPLGDTSESGAGVEFKSGIRKPIPEESKHIEVIGVWDTVGSLGVPKIMGKLSMPTFNFGVGGALSKPGRQFHDVSISNTVHHAFHALALDERRRPFSPTLWYVPTGQSRPIGSSFKQVWFPGVHINVGGGSDDPLTEKKADFEQIANITFAWMVEQCRKHLAFDDEGLANAIQDQKNFLYRLRQDQQPFPTAFVSKTIPAFKWLYGSMTGAKWPMVNAQPGWGVGKVVDSFSDASLAIELGGSRWRSPGETWVPTSVTEKSEVRTTSLGETHEEIHPCVFYRMRTLGKKSPALKEWTRQPCVDPSKGWEYVKEGGKVKPLMEYRIRPHPENGPPNLERLVADAGKASDYVKKLDAVYDGGPDETGEDKITALGI